MAYITLMSDDIIYAECYAHELIIHTYEHEYAVKMTLKKFMEQVNKHIVLFKYIEVMQLI